MNIIGRKNIFLGISTVLISAAVIAIAVFGFRQGIDFAGGTLWQFGIAKNAPSADNLESFFSAQGGSASGGKSDESLVGAIVTYDEVNNNFMARLPVISEQVHQKLVSALKDKYPSLEEASFQSIGPSVSNGLRKNAITAMIFVILGISFYVAFAFRKVYQPVSSWVYGLITLLTLFHDVVIPAGLLALLGHYARIEIDSNFVVALLVVMGFSVHDTIVVFDRIRENLLLDRGKAVFAELVNRSVNQTMARSVNTSLTLIFVLLAIYFVGPASLHYFVLTLLVGVTTGIYSSIFVASPLLVLWHSRKR
ncbi:MAG: protein translocase subunit SecF [Candidatus Liptonbacteria bacterium]|nr:protein translocase subunit SecF [Candidatus Liptonbacteria bacterium]